MTDVAVVGGGVIGLACAWQLAGEGLSVSVVDPAPGRAASWVAGGMLAPTAEAWVGEEGLTALGLAANRLWPTFVEALGADAGRDVGYTRQGTLVAARDADDAAQLTQLVELHRGWGLASERLSGREARRLEPALSPSVRSALWLADDHQVDNRLLIQALLAGCEARDVTMVASRAERIEGGRVVLTDGGSVDAGAVVVATGAWTVPIDGLDAAAVPVRPVKGQILRVQATDRAVMPTHTVRGLDVYVIPRSHGEIAIGASAEERGFDTTVTAGAVHELLRDAWDLLPGLAEATFVEAAAGLRPGTPDNLPILGRPPGLDTLVLAMGHYRNGVLLAPLTAALVTATITGGPAGPVDDAAHLLGICAPDRFGALAGAGATP